MKKFLSIFAACAILAAPVIAEPYGQWYDSDGGSCGDGPARIEFNEGFIFATDGTSTVEGVDLGIEQTQSGSITFLKIRNNDGLEHSIDIFDQDGQLYLMITVLAGMVPIFPCDTPEPQF